MFFNSVFLFPSPQSSAGLPVAFDCFLNLLQLGREPQISLSWHWHFWKGPAGFRPLGSLSLSLCLPSVSKLESRYRRVIIVIRMSMAQTLGCCQSFRGIMLIKSKEFWTWREKVDFKQLNLKPWKSGTHHWEEKWIVFFFFLIAASKGLDRLISINICLKQHTSRSIFNVIVRV